MAIYTLPELEFDYGALEPHVSARIMELHHGKHHAAYVKNANQTLVQLEEARDKAATTASPIWSARWHSIYQGTYSTRSSGYA